MDVNNIIVPDYETYKLLSNNLMGYNFLYPKDINYLQPDYGFSVSLFKFQLVHKTISKDHVQIRAVKKIVTPEILKTFETSRSYGDYLDTFYEMHEGAKIPQLDQYKTETHNEWIDRCLLIFKVPEVYCLFPIITEHYSTMISENGETIGFFEPYNYDVVKMHNCLLKFCDDLESLNIPVSLILPPKNGIDDCINATLESYNDKDEEWKNEMDGFLDDYNSSMNEETDGFWNFQQYDN